MVGNWGTTPNSPSLVLALIDMLVVQSHIMWRWSPANSHNWTSCFLFSPLLACFTVWPCFSVYCCTFSFVSGHAVGFIFCLFVCLFVLFFFSSCLILYIVIRPLGRDFVQIKSYHIINIHKIHHLILYLDMFKASQVWHQFYRFRKSHSFAPSHLQWLELEKPVWMTYLKLS